MASELERIRKQAGWSRDKAAVEAGVAYATARAYELNPEAIGNPVKRAALDRVYQAIRELAEKAAA